MSNYPDAISPHEKEGWWWVEYVDDSGHYREYPEPPEYYWLCLSPKLRLFDYPGGTARGQLAKADFESLLAAYLTKDLEKLVRELKMVNGIPYEVLKVLVKIAKVI